MEGITMGLLFNPETEPQFGRENCFLCGVLLNGDRNSDEHVIPKWVQKRYELGDQELTLLNGTKIPYRQVTIPCCADCNTKYLSKIETEVQRASDQGAAAVRALPPLTLFLWAGKIFFGLLYRERLLPWNRRNQNEGQIVSPQVLDEFRLHHQFLQAARVPMEFVPHIPASVFVFETLEPTNPKLRFDYFDLFYGMGLAIRVGKVGIVACLQDGGATKYAFGQQYQELEKFSLHPIQFAEVTARIFYDLSRFNCVPKFMLAEGGGRVQVALSPLGGLSGRPLFVEWSKAEHAKFLARYTRVPLDVVLPEPDTLMSWLVQDGHFIQMLPDDGL
jgi:hypothetical protein